MKNLILTLAFGLVSLVTFSQAYTVSGTVITTHVDTDTTYLKLSKNSEIVLNPNEELLGYLVDTVNFPNESVQQPVGMETYSIADGDTIYFKMFDGMTSTYLQVIFTDETASVSENTVDVTNLKVYPNPATTDVKITFESNTENAEVVVLNTAGQVVYSNTENKSFGTNTLDVNVSDWQKGMYFAKSGKQTFKFVVM